LGLRVYGKVTSSLPPQAMLLDSLYGTERGLSASSELRGEISELITQLEAANPSQSLEVRLSSNSNRRLRFQWRAAWSDM